MALKVMWKRDMKHCEEKVVNIFLTVAFLGYNIKVDWFHLCLNPENIYSSVAVPYLLGLLTKKEGGGLCIFYKEGVVVRQDLVVVVLVRIYL